jgi:deoxyadenosine/deoxycytidine kinase
LQKVHDRHEEWVNRQKNLKVLNIDTGAYDFENPEQLGQLLVAIKQFIE